MVWLNHHFQTCVMKSKVSIESFILLRSSFKDGELLEREPRELSRPKLPDRHPPETIDEHLLEAGPAPLNPACLRSVSVCNVMYVIRAP